MRKYIQQNIWIITGYTIGLIIFILILAYIINFITKLDLGFDVSNNSIWISFYATMLAAIVGGVISGGLTLLGVIHTINSQDKKERRNQLPKKMMEAQSLYEKINTMVDTYEKYNQLDRTMTFLPKHSLESIRKKVKEDLELKQQYLESSASVNFELYDDIYSIFEKITNIDEIVNANKMTIVQHDYDQDSEFITDYKGYDRNIYENINIEIESMKILRNFVNEIIANLGIEYKELSK